MILLIKKILHDLMYQNPRNCGGTVYVGLCRIYVIEPVSTVHVALLSRILAAHVGYSRGGLRPRLVSGCALGMV